MLHSNSLLRLVRVRRALRKVLYEKVKGTLWGEIPPDLLLQGSGYYLPWLDFQVKDIISGRFLFVYDREKKALSFIDKGKRLPSISVYDGGKSKKVLFIFFPGKEVDIDDNDSANIFSLLDGGEEGFQKKAEQLLESFLKGYEI